MADQKNPFEAIQIIMLDNLEKVQKAVQGLPGANKEAIANFKTYLERQVAANREFLEKLLHAKDFGQAFRIQVEHLQSQLKVVAEDAGKFGSQIMSSLKPPTTT